MTGLEKLMKWYLEKDTRRLTVDEMLGIVIDKANILLAEEQAQKHPYPDTVVFGSVKEANEYANTVEHAAMKLAEERGQSAPDTLVEELEEYIYKCGKDMGIPDEDGFPDVVRINVDKFNDILSRHPASTAQANTGDGLTETLRKIMLKEHYSWDRSNESLLVIMREGGEMRLASHFEECLLNAIARYDKWGEAAREEEGPCRS